MTAFISSINYCPVKSVSFQNIESCEIRKNIGIIGDRIFAFSKNLEFEKVKLFEKDPEFRKGKWNKILTLKNSPFLNKYNFTYAENKLALFVENKEILTIDVNENGQRDLLSKKILELESSLKKPLFLMKNEDNPFFDTAISNKTSLPHSISLLNNKSIQDFQNKIGIKIESSRFRGNICIDGIEPWAEQDWVGKVIKINDISFRVEKKIPRCIAINLKPGSDDNSLNLLQFLKKTYNHFDMGIYLTVLENGKINIGDKILEK